MGIIVWGVFSRLSPFSWNEIETATISLLFSITEAHHSLLEKSPRQNQKGSKKSVINNVYLDVFPLSHNSQIEKVLIGHFHGFF